MTPSPQQTRENPEPQEAHNPVPTVIVALVSLMLGWGLGYLMAARPDADAALGDQRVALVAGASAGAATAAAVDGGALYAAHCAACHQADGKGLPGVFPPLAHSEWVVGDPDTLLQILLHGLSGPIDVAGQTYEGAMPPFGTRLGDAEIAAIANHVRSNWGNTAAAIPVTAAASARAATADRSTPWNGGAELAARTP